MEIKLLKYVIGILIGFYLVYKFPIEKDVENAMRGADEVFSAIMDSVDDGIGRQDNSLSE